MLLSPEILIAGASVVDTSGGHVGTPQWPGVFGPTGVQEQGAGTRGLLGNLGGPAVSVVTAGWSPGLPTPGGSTALVPSWWGRTGDETAVPPNEGNEVRRDEREGVAALIVAKKRGN